MAPSVCMYIYNHMSPHSCMSGMTAHCAAIVDVSTWSTLNACSNAPVMPLLWKGVV